jgi:hypothetical protein
MRRGAWTAAWLLALAANAGCAREMDMPERAEMPDSMPVVRAMHDPVARDSMLDTIPGGEMARGNRESSEKLLRRKH